MNRRLQVVLLASLFASFGGWINFLAVLNLAVWHFNATPFELILLSAALLLPSVFLTKAVSFICTRYVGSAVIVLSLASTVVTTAALLAVPDITLFLIVVALKSAALSFVDPWEMRYVTVSCSQAEQAGAFRALTLSQNIAKIGAPAAGAVLTAWVGNGQTMFLSIALLAVAIALMLLAVPLRIASSDAAPEVKPRVVRGRFSGPLVPLLYCVVTSFAMSAAINNQFPRMLKVERFDASVLGLLVSCAAIGGIIGSILPLRRTETASNVGSLVGLSIASACGFIAMGAIFRLPPHTATYLFGCAFFGTGLIGARFRIACRLYITQHCPDTVASASATLQSYTMLTQFIAPCGGALLVEYLSTGDVFFVLGTTATVILLAGSVRFRHRSDRRGRWAIRHGGPT